MKPNTTETRLAPLSEIWLDMGERCRRPDHPNFAQQLALAWMYQAGGIGPTAARHGTDEPPVLVRRWIV